MKILLTNDDGIYADGLRSLRLAFQDSAELTVVAPDRERSATGHGITVHRPLRVERVRFHDSDIEGIAVDGTPSDCVKLAVEALMESPPDIVISGINRGCNLGTDVLYSGTVSAAIESVILGIPAMAVSLVIKDEGDYSYAAAFAKRVAKAILENGLPPDTLLNINVPSVSADRITGTAITRLGTRRYENVFDQRTDPRGKTYYWLAGEAIELDDSPDTDYMAVLNNTISITPIHFDLTKYNLMETLRAWKF